MMVVDGLMVAPPPGASQSYPPARARRPARPCAALAAAKALDGLEAILREVQALQVQ